MNPDCLMQVVAAAVRYDLYPYYIVVKGKLKSDGGIIVPDYGSYHPESVLRIFSSDAYFDQEAKHKKIRDTYREKERQLRIDILEQNGVNFVTVK